ncbi:hypothetical protein Bbelb_322690 [Branchiostoma belcheri]|nr:hypothetical protein Bbelb_322690 [Branchiostoma belcheri]
MEVGRQSVNSEESAFPKGTRSVARQDSNPGPLDSESSTLPLRHTTPHMSLCYVSCTTITVNVQLTNQLPDRPRDVLVSRETAREFRKARAGWVHITRAFHPYFGRQGQNRRVGTDTANLGTTRAIQNRTVLGGK